MKNYERQMMGLELNVKDILTASRKVVINKTPDAVVALMDTLIDSDIIDNVMQVVSSNFSTATDTIEILINRENSYSFIMITENGFRKFLVDDVAAQALTQKHLSELNHRPDIVIRDITAKYMGASIITDSEIDEFVKCVEQFIFKESNEKFISSNIDEFYLNGPLEVYSNRHLYKFYSDGFSLKIKICSNIKYDIMQRNLDKIKNYKTGEYKVNYAIKKIVVDVLIKIGYLPANSIEVLAGVDVTVINDGSNILFKVVKNGITVTVPLQTLEALM